MEIKKKSFNKFDNNYFIVSLLLILSLCTFFYRLGGPNFYDLRIESRRAEIAREMYETGNYLVPHLEEKPILTKPPLFYWAVSFCYSNFGVNEFAARIPCAISGVGTIIFTFLLGSLLFNRTVGVLSALVLMSTNLFMDQVRTAEMESMLTFFITAAIYFFIRGHTEPGRARLWFPLFFAAMGFGTMTKGPFAFTFPLIPIIGYLLIYRDMKVLLSRAFLYGIIAFFIIILPWPLLILKIYPQFLYLVYGETILRVAKGFAHKEPLLYYFGNLGDNFFPWIFFLPFSVWMALSRRCREKRREMVFFLLWFAGNIVFLSLSKSKREFYILPIVPGAALLVASTWGELWKWAREKAGAKSFIIGKGCIVTGCIFAIISFFAGNPFVLNFPSLHFPRAASLLLFLGVVFIVVPAIRLQFQKASTASILFATLVLLMLISQYLYLTYTVPVRNIEDSGKSFYIQASAMVSRKQPLACYSPYENYTLTFYAQRPIITLENREEVKRYMDSPERRFIIMTQRRLKKFMPVSWNVLLKSRYSEHRSWGGYVLLCNKIIPK